MATLANVISFNPLQQDGVLEFSLEADGQAVNARVFWLYISQRSYIQLFNTLGETLLLRPLVASPLASDISLTDGVFTSRIIYRADLQQIEYD